MPHPSPVTVQRLDAATLRVTRPSPLTGQVNSMDLPVTEEQWARFLAGGTLIQRVFPDLSADQREFLQTGYTREDWEKMFPPEEE